MPKPYATRHADTARRRASGSSYSGARGIMDSHKKGSAGSTRASHGDVCKKNTGLYGSRFNKPSGYRSK